MSEALNASLSRLLGEGALEPHFQPIVRLSDRAVVGVEALARWRTVDGDVIPALIAYGAADAIGARPALTRHMIGRAVEVFGAARWSAGLELSVNAACPDLASGVLVEQLLTDLQAAGVAPERVWLELTEDAPLGDGEAVARALARLRGEGVRIAIDDFGTGYAGLNWLMALPVDGVKLDATFTAAADQGVPRAQTIISHALTLAKALGLSTVAEGVETTAQAAAMAGMGCLRGQGRAFGMPVSDADWRRARGQGSA